MPQGIDPPLPRCAIVLCTLNGAAHVQAQLDSILGQDHQGWDLWVSDDGSTDDTLAILRQFQTDQAPRHQVHILSGPRKGAAVNFLSLLCHPDLPKDRPIVLSDQDDIWHPNRIRRACLATTDTSTPTLYGACSHIGDAAGQVMRPSAKPVRGPSFANALVQNIISGHTAALCPLALALIQKAGCPQGPGVPFHDWWLYLVVTACGGQVVWDATPTVIYRQHPANLMGSPTGFAARASRLGQLFNGQLGRWMDQNITALTHSPLPVSADAKTCLDALGSRNLRGVARAGLHRQSRLHTLALYGAAALGRLAP